MGHHLVKKGFLIPNFKAKMSPTNKVCLKKFCGGLFMKQNLRFLLFLADCSLIQSQIYAIKCSVFSYYFFVSHSVVLTAQSRKHEAVEM